MSGTLTLAEGTGAFATDPLARAITHGALQRGYLPRLVKKGFKGKIIATPATLAVAESCTGGLMAKQLTDVPGSSGFFLLSAVTYANEAKMAVLGVAPETLERNGAVDEATAREMAEGARRCAGADYALSTTGIAGPDGGTAEKPVGTVCIGLATPEGTRTFRYVFPFGDRDLNRRLFAATEFDRLRQYLLGTLRVNGSTEK